jgi:hypothetical protein
MNPEVTVTLKISARDGNIVVTAVQRTGAEEQVLEIASADGPQDPAAKDLPPPPQLETFESVGSTDLPPVPEVDQAFEQGALESQAVPDLPPVPEALEPRDFAAFESLAAPELPPVPEAPQGESFP